MALNKSVEYEILSCSNRPCNCLRALEYWHYLLVPGSYTSKLLSGLCHQCSVPTQWKEAEVIPLLKESNPEKDWYLNLLHTTAELETKPFSESACETEKCPCGDKGICIPSYGGEKWKCKYSPGYTGIPCEPRTCFHLLKSGIHSSGVYNINPDGINPMTVWCDMTTDGGGWTVFQRRVDGSVNFYRGWAEYKFGFGNLNGEFWLGNDKIHRLSAAGNMTLRVDLEDFDGVITFAEYSLFKVSDGADKYRLWIGGYHGTAGDSMKYHNDMQFSTKDQDNDFYPSSCAERFKGAWWYRYCHTSNLNGQYLGGPHVSFADGVNWYYFRGHYYSLKSSEMKLRPKE